MGISKDRASRDHERALSVLFDRDPQSVLADGLLNGLFFHYKG